MQGQIFTQGFDVMASALVTFFLLDRRAEASQNGVRIAKYTAEQDKPAARYKTSVLHNNYFYHAQHDMHTMLMCTIQSWCMVQIDGWRLKLLKFYSKGVPMSQ